MFVVDIPGLPPTPKLPLKGPVIQAVTLPLSNIQADILYVYLIMKYEHSC
jgi:hypothetical protein